MLSRTAMVEKLLGLPVLDRDHKQLVTLLSLLKDALDLGDRELSRTIGHTLLRKAEVHFANEGELFQRTSYPNREVHERGHDLVLRRLEELSRALDVETPIPSLHDDVVEIEEMFARNLLPQDEEFVRFLRETEDKDGSDQTGQT